MKLFGVTGGIAMGKSTVGHLLEGAGTKVIDSDVIARDLVAPGEESLRDIERAFGPAMLDPEGKLRRDLLAQKVFADPAARVQLERILHPRIRSEWKSQVKSATSAGESIIAVIIPLLFETGCQAEFDKVVCVACTPSVQYQRLIARCWSETQIEGRLAAQWPIEKKISLADYVIWNEAGEGELFWQLRRIGLIAGGIATVPRTGDSREALNQLG